MLSVGLVGLPNAGKSSLFNLLTKRSIPAENFPFTTIEPNDGIVEVPDKRVPKLAEISHSQKIIQTAIEFKDIAGLVKNAHKGEGLGNKFLSHIQEVDLILMVLRAFENDDIIHVENRINPQEDKDILMLELTLRDKETLEKHLQKDKKDKLINQKTEIAKKIIQKLDNLEPAINYEIEETADQELKLWRQQLQLLTDKPILFLSNISNDGENVEFESNFKLDIKTEAEVSEMTIEERKELGLDTETGLDKMIQECYKKLNLATFLTCGEKESRAWTFTKGMTAPQCSGEIHSDFEKKFIKAEVVKFEDFVENNGWKNCYEKGLVKTQGKNYIFEDGDITEFKIGG